MAEQIGCGSSSLVSLADDVLGIIGKSLSTTDICNLSMSCKRLNVDLPFDKFWLTKCEELGILSCADLVEWRKAVVSYKALCRFLTSVKPLLGIWVNENPQLGNVVYVMPGFASVIGCRIIPQYVGNEDGSILWAPVFEIVSNDKGTINFNLHGKEKGLDYIYPGIVKTIEKTCNVLLLEVEAVEKSNKSGKNFNELSFEDRDTLLETVTRSVRVVVPDLTSGSIRKDVARSSEHQEILIKLHELGGDYPDTTDDHEDTSELWDFLKSDGRFGLTLQATTMGLSYYQSTWPYTNGHLFALYKLPIVAPSVGQEYAGLWAGTFAGPPRKPTKNTPLFFVVLSYNEEPPAQRRLIATKILEGSVTARRPNGSTMFSVDVDKPSTESLPWNSDSPRVGVTQAFVGEGIADGYGFRYPGSTPGSLFVLEDGMLAFLWTEKASVLTLQRVNLDELLRKGQRLPPLRPIDNFSYLDRCYHNVYTESNSGKINYYSRRRRSSP